MRYISRVDRRGHHFWQVDIQPKKEWGVSKNFFDGKYGGTRSALIKAKLYRDSQAKLLKEHLQESWLYRQRGWHEEWRRKRNYEYLYITAQYKKDGLKQRKSFSVNKYGYDEAIKLAIAWKKKAIAERIF